MYEYTTTKLLLSNENVGLIPMLRKLAEALIRCVFSKSGMMIPTSHGSRPFKISKNI